MKPGRTLASFLALVVVVGGLGPTRARIPAEGEEFAPARVLVRFREGSSAAARDNALRAVDGKVTLTIPRIGYVLVRLPDGTAVADAILKLERSPAIEVAEPNYTGSIATLPAPADPCVGGCSAGKQWDLGAVNALAGWNVYPGRYFTAAAKLETQPVKVAVLDTQIDTSLTDWANRDAPASHQEDASSGGQLDMAEATSFIGDGTQFGAARYHGSFVAGIIGAGTDNTRSIAGFGYAAQILPITVVDGEGKTDAAALAAGISYAVDKGAKVINLSLGIDADSSAVRAAVASAWSAGRLVVAAAGNKGSSAAFYPAWYTGAMPVTALAEDDRPGSCTNFSGKTSVGAPGVGIVSLDPASATKLRKEGCGTSTATPHVSALAALLFMQDPTRTAAQVRSIIERTADDARSDLYPGRDSYYGHGRINFERALRDSTPGLPHVTKLLSSIPPATGGASRATAVGTASAAATLARAELFVDSIGAPGTGAEVRALDGAFDETQEQLEADVDVPFETFNGVHRVFVRAQDVNGNWGPAAVAALVVDRIPPQITELQPADGNPYTALPAGNRPMRLHFKLTDDASSRATTWFEVWRTVAGSRQVAFASTPKSVLLPYEEVTATWTPQPTDVGVYNVTVYAIDEASNRADATTTVVAV